MSRPMTLLPVTLIDPDATVGVVAGATGGVTVSIIRSPVIGALITMPKELLPCTVMVPVSVMEPLKTPAPVTRTPVRLPPEAQSPYWMPVMVLVGAV